MQQQELTVEQMRAHFRYFQELLADPENCSHEWRMANDPGYRKRIETGREVAS